MILLSRYELLHKSKFSPELNPDEFVNCDLKSKV